MIRMLFGKDWKRRDIRRVIGRKPTPTGDAFTTWMAMVQNGNSCNISQITLLNAMIIRSRRCYDLKANRAKCPVLSSRGRLPPKRPTC